MANGESNGHLTDDVTWPQKVKLDPNTLRAISWKQLELLFSNNS